MTPEETKKEYMRRWYLANRNTKVAEYRRRNQEKINARSRERYKQDEDLRAKAKSQAADYRRRNPGRRRDNDLRSMYGISAAEYDALLANQGGGRAICRAATDPNPRIRYLHVDHDHATGEVRGILCSWCNLAIGKLRDDAENARRAAEYLANGGVTNAARRS